MPTGVEESISIPPDLEATARASPQLSSDTNGHACILHQDKLYNLGYILLLSPPKETCLVMKTKLNASNVYTKFEWHDPRYSCTQLRSFF